MAGYCPMGCGQTLMLIPDGRISCSKRTCPSPFALAVILADPETEHVAKINDEGEFVALMHPLSERVHASLLDCDLIEHVVADVQTGNAPEDGGRYRVFYVGHDLDSSYLGAPMCNWDRLDG